MLCRKIQIISLPPTDLTTPLSAALLKIIFRKSVAAHRTSGRLSAAKVPMRQFSEEWMEELFIFFVTMSFLTMSQCYIISVTSSAFTIPELLEIFLKENRTHG